jgi:hypothetical protein
MNHYLPCLCHETLTLYSFVFLSLSALEDTANNDKQQQTPTPTPMITVSASPLPSVRATAHWLKAVDADTGEGE